jgi:hypothetical protein
MSQSKPEVVLPSYNKLIPVLYFVPYTSKISFSMRVLTCSVLFFKVPPTIPPGLWSTWADWSKCKFVGVQYRTRDCKDVDKPCVGGDKQERQCYPESKPTTKPTTEPMPTPGTPKGTASDTIKTLILPT